MLVVRDGLLVQNQYVGDVIGVDLCSIIKRATFVELEDLFD